MLQILWEAVVDSFRAPRRAARRIVDVIDTPEEVALVFGLSFCLNAIILALRLTFSDADASAVGVIGVVFSNLFVSLLAFGVVIGFVYVVGRFFRGEGGLIAVAAVIAWHSLVTVVFAPFIQPGAFVSEPEPGFAVQLLIVAVVTWMLVNFVAEAHRFESAWRVAGVMFSGLFAMGLILPFLFSGLIPAP